jgi:hypothetical protein
MSTITEFLDETFSGQARMTSDEIRRRAVAGELAPEDLARLDQLPEGEYSIEEVTEILGDAAAPEAVTDEGVPAEHLDDVVLLRELASLHRTRHDTLLHGSAQALQRHSERTTELELEYLRRNPARDVDTDRLRSGARARSAP